MPHRFLILVALIVAGFGAVARGQSPGSYVADIRAYRLHGGAQGSIGVKGNIFQIETTGQNATYSLQQFGGIQIGDLTIESQNGEITWNGQPTPPVSSTVIANTTVEGRFGEDLVVRTLDASPLQYLEPADPNDWRVFRPRILDDSVGFVATLRVDNQETYTVRKFPPGAVRPTLVLRAAIPEGRERIDHVPLDVGKPILFTSVLEAKPMVQPDEWFAFCTVSRDNGSLVTLLRIRDTSILGSSREPEAISNGFLFESRVFEITGRFEDDASRSVLANSIDGPPVKMLLEPALHDFPVIDGDCDEEQTAAALHAFLGGVPRAGKASLLSAPRLTLNQNPDTRYKLLLVDSSAVSSNPASHSPKLGPFIGDWLARMEVGQDWLATAETGAIKFGIIADFRTEALSYRIADSDDKVDSFMEYAGLVFGVQARTVQDGAFSIQFAFEDRRLTKNHRKVFLSLEAAQALASSTAFTSTYQTKPGDVTPFLYSETEKRHILILVRVTNMEGNT